MAFEWNLKFFHETNEGFYNFSNNNFLTECCDISLGREGHGLVFIAIDFYSVLVLFFFILMYSTHNPVYNYRSIRTF